MRRDTNTLKLPSIIRDHSYVIICFGSFSLFILGCVFAAWSLFGFQQVSYTYSERVACVTSPKLLPQLFRSTQDADFRLDREASLAVFGVPVYSHSFCVIPTAAPKAQTEQRQREAFLGISLLGKPINIQSASYAQVGSTVAKNKAVPVDKPLLFKLDKPDETFSYQVSANDKTGPCAANGQELSCDISHLEFEHAKTYDLAVLRTFAGKTIDTATTQTTETLTPITITASSIAEGSIVYDKPTEISFETDKSIDTLDTFKLVGTDAAGAETELKTSTDTSEKRLVVRLAEPLPRKQTLRAEVNALHATDGSGLSKPFVLKFTTSGGPAVTGTNIGRYAVASGQTITVNFDQPLASDQNWAKLVTLTVNGQVKTAGLSAQNKQLAINPASDFPLCASFTVKLSAEIQSNHGISGDSAWTFNSRARCASIGSIGTSAGGRTITSYRFGSGANPVVYIGTIHGNETSAKVLLDNWVNELEANAGNIPAGRSIVVIPVTNPDGFASNSRLNANSVDLNRNFPANDWKPSVTVPGGQILPLGGGATSLSEPESQALAAFVQRERPRLLLTYHAKASIIEANEAGDSMSIAYLYAKTSRYRAVSKSQNTSFQHDTTGALEDWMRDKLGLPALCIELTTQSSNEFTRNKTALWDMAKL